MEINEKNDSSLQSDTHKQSVAKARRIVGSNGLVIL